MTNDQNWHRCDPQIDIDVSDTPLTQLRVLRVMLPVLDGLNLAEAHQAMREFGDCPKCLRQGFSIAVGFAVDSLAEHGGTAGDRVMACEMFIAQLEAKLGDGGC
jgi:hypothetical protein